MSFRKTLKVTPAKVAANRRNAQKSTGPRTFAGKQRASVNGYQHGLYATLDSRRRQAMLELKDDVEGFEKLRQDLLTAWNPRDAMQVLVVEDLAGLYWKKRELESMALNTRILENKLAGAQARERIFQVERRAAKLEDFMSPPTGTRGTVTSTLGLDETCRLLDKISAGLVGGGALEECASALRRIYSEKPSRRGREIIAEFERFSKGPGAAGPAGENLMRLLAEERAFVIDEFASMGNKVRIEEELKQVSHFDPGRENWKEINTIEAGLDREIASKVKLLIELRKNFPGQVESALSGQVPIAEMG